MGNSKASFDCCWDTDCVGKDRFKADVVDRFGEIFCKY